MTPGSSLGTTVTILLARACDNCEHARDLARHIALARPDIRVRVQDVDEPGWSPPAGFIGTPTWLIDGDVVALGNPTPAWLLDRLEEVAR